MFTKKVPVYYVIVVSLVIGLCTILIIKNNSNTLATNTVVSSGMVCDPYIVRLRDYKYVNKLLYAEKECESSDYAGLKQEISDYIQAERNAGKITTASVFIRVYNSHGEWICVNPNEEYHASSLMKLPVLFMFARMAELTPDILDTKVLYTGHDNSLPIQVYKSKTLQPGHSYSVRELLRYLIAYSDNDALYLLYKLQNPDIYKKIFTDLGLPYRENSSDGPLTVRVKDYSVLLRVLYNGTYLSAASSEYALSLLTESDFVEGLKKGIPDSITIAHKFGEYYNSNESQLHEAAVVYSPQNNYIITVMTKGKDIHILPEIISNISRMTYSYITGQ